jgi:Tfp pilus assembly protein PilO
MNKREKVLAGIVGGIAAVMLNLFLLNYFLRNHRQLRSTLEQQQVQIDAMKALAADRAMWEERGAWIRAHQPALENEATAGVQLLEEMRVMAREHSVLIIPETLSIGSPERRPYCTAVPVTIETKSTWRDLIRFLGTLQGPNRFIVLESANLRQDPGDKTQMRGKFRIAKWYAPAGGSSNAAPATPG